jgi:hypothetical protein
MGRVHEHGGGPVSLHELGLFDVPQEVNRAADAQSFRLLRQAALERPGSGYPEASPREAVDHKFHGLDQVSEPLSNVEAARRQYDWAALRAALTLPASAEKTGIHCVAHYSYAGSVDAVVVQLVGDTLGHGPETVRPCNQFPFDPDADRDLKLD